MDVAERSGRKEDLRPEAAPFVPKQGSRPRMKPIRVSGGRRDVLSTLDSVPFTPSQGICTPSPTRAAAAAAAAHQAATAYASPFEYASHAWDTVAAHGFSGSPGPNSSSHSDSSGYHGSDHSASQSGSPASYAGAAPLLFSSFYFPMPISPTALQVAASYGSGAVAGSLSPPGWQSPPGSYVPGSFDGSPQRAAPASRAASFPPAPRAAAPAGRMGSDGSGSIDGDAGSGGGGMAIEVTPASRQLAEAICASQNVQGEPPQAMVELASLLQAYGLVPAAIMSMPAASAARVKRKLSTPKFNPDGSIRLNARQRRTLRRAQERALQALADMQSLDGADAEQLMARLAMSNTTVFGSPPVGPSPAMQPALYGLPLAGQTQGLASPFATAHSVDGLSAMAGAGRYPNGYPLDVHTHYQHATAAAAAAAMAHRSYSMPVLSVEAQQYHQQQHHAALQRRDTSSYRTGGGSPYRTGGSSPYNAGAGPRGGPGQRSRFAPGGREAVAVRC